MTKEAPINTSEMASFAEKEDVFNKYFPSGQIEMINVDKIPSVVNDYFEFKSEQLIDPKDYKPGNFNMFFLIKHVSGEFTYGAQQTKTYDHKKGSTEILVHLVDIDQFGNKQGDGEIRNNISDNHTYFKNKPFAGWTKTEENFTERGLGLRRFLMMNALSQMLYSLPLHSDTIILDKAKRILEKLLANGKVEKYKEGERDRYVFKK
jgi:hypothetical protein